jgi:CheY-like chemotaxis protein
MRELYSGHLAHLNCVTFSFMGDPVILAVDDEADLCVLMDRILSRRGYAVTTAGGVTEALAALAAMPTAPDLLITDINMPDGRGIELAERVREKVGDLPVLYVSGHSRAHAESAGTIPVGSAMLEKPFLPNQLAEAVAKALSGI